MLIIPELLADRGEARGCSTNTVVRLHAQTLPGATPPIGKIHLLGKIAVTYERMTQFLCPLGF